MKLIWNCLKISKYSSDRVREIISQVTHCHHVLDCHCIGMQYTGERNLEGELGGTVIIKKNLCGSSTHSGCC
jgi:hypothetical protein